MQVPITIALNSPKKLPLSCTELRLLNLAVLVSIVSPKLLRKAISNGLAIGGNARIPIPQRRAGAYG